jgi:outer membrane protein TolC
VDFQSLLDSERVLLDARLEYFQAVSDFAQALGDLERATGIALPAGTTMTVSTQEER